MRRKFLIHRMPTLALSLAAVGLSALLLWLVCLSSLGHAQAPPITPSGLNTQVSGPIGIGGTTQYNIMGGTRAGTNLFHSFGEFGVPNNNIANFLNEASNPATSNILGRITGGNISHILGTIQTTGFGNANLFLMNAAGFLFGPNATVNVGGMVAFTSADYLRLTDDARFNAIPNATADALLSAAPVVAFGFLGSNPGAITVQGSRLAVAPGSGISLIGGDITIRSGLLEDGITVQPAQLAAPGGQINLASVSSPGEILAGTLKETSNANGQSFVNLGTVHISEKSLLDVSGDGGGSVVIRGGRLVVDDSMLLANVSGPGPVVNDIESIGRGIDVLVAEEVMIQNGSLLDTSVLGSATPGVQYGGVTVKAGAVEILGSEDFDNFPLTGIFSGVASGSTGGSSGDITLEANSISVRDFGTFTTLLFSETGGTGNSGNINLRATGNIELVAGQILTSSLAGASGSAGNIDLTSTTENVAMTIEPFVSSQSSPFSSGSVGNIKVSAPEGDVILADFGTLFTNISGTGANAGKGGIELTARNLTLLSGGIQIDNFTEFQPGDLTVNLSGKLEMGGTDPPSTLLTTTRRSARSADLNITAHDISLTDGALVSTETFRDGDGGTLNISTQHLEVTNGSQITSSSIFNRFPTPGQPLEIPSGAGGLINIQGLSSPAASILIEGADSGIFTNTEGTGEGGNITLTANLVTIQNGGTISAATSGIAPSATGGSITVNAQQMAVNSQAVITADTNGIAPAGVVDINTGTLAINSGGQIRSSSGAETEQVSAFALSLAAPSLTGGTVSIQGQNGNGSQADTVTIDGAGSGIFTQSTGNRPGGDINVLTSQSVAMTNGASVSASSTGTGNAGHLNINAGNQFAMTNSKVTTEANQASGGAIKITTTPSGTVQLTDSTITASVLDGTGGGGSVDIDPQFVILQNSQILANSVFGPGGNISITTNLLLPDTTSVISASSQFGQQGTIVIQSPVSPGSGKIIPLGQKPLVATALLSQRCAALAAGTTSSFTVAGRDSLPPEPGGWVSSPLALSMAESSDGTLRQEGTYRNEREVAEETPLLSLRKIAPPGFLTQNFPSDSSNCQS